MKYFAVDCFKTVSFFSIFILLSLCVSAQTISIPDAEFERYLIDEGIDSDGTPNFSIPEADVIGVVELNMNGYNIADFEGIQSFSDLRLFEMRNNEGLLNSIDFEGNPALEEIRVYRAPNLANIDVSQNNLLTYFVVYTNGGFFNSIDLSNNVNLDLLVIRDSNLLSLNVDNNVNLNYLDFGLNPVSSIDVSSINQLEFLILDRTSIQILDLSENTSLTYFNGLDCELNYVNLQNGSNNILNLVWLTENPDLTCILVDDVNYAENAPNWSIDETATYIDSAISIDSPAQDAFFEYDGLGNQADFDNWLNNHGGATASSSCGSFTWTYQGIFTDDPIIDEENNAIKWVTSFIVTDENGNTDFTSATIFLQGINFFEETFYGRGQTVCDDTLDLNSVITNIQPTANLNTLGLTYEFSEFEGPSGASFSETIVEFPDTGAGNFSYAFKVNTQRDITVYYPLSQQMVNRQVEEEVSITISDKTVALQTLELQDINQCPGGQISSIDDLSDLLVFANLPIGTTVNPNFYWSPNTYEEGTTTYTFNPSDAFPGCDANIVTITITVEEELSAGDDVLDAVDDSSYLCGDTVSFDLSIYLDDFADSGGRWYDSNDVELTSSVVEFPDTGAGNFTKSFKYRQENEGCGFFSEADYAVTYDVAEFSVGTNTIFEICAGITVTEQDLIDQLGADSGGFWSPNIDDILNVQPGVYFYSQGDCGISGDSEIELIATNCSTTISAKLFLQGASINPNIGQESLMRDDLRIGGHIPTISPYTDALSCDSSVFDTGGSSGTGLIDDDIVDWVFVELRDNNDATSILYSRSAFVQRDGDIVAEDGISDVSILAAYDDYYLALKHRNHLGIISSSVIALNESTTTANFTDNSLMSLGTNSQAVLDSGITALWAGDVNGDGQVRYLGPNNDTNFLKSVVVNEPGNDTNSNFYPFSGYNNSDINLNGQIRYLGPNNDTNILKFIVIGHPSNGTLSNFFPFTTQIPE